MSEPEKTLDDIVLTRLLHLNAKVQGLVTGILLGLVIFLATNWLILKGPTIGSKGQPLVGPHLGLLGQYFIGYSVTFLGSLIGFAYGFVIGFVVGYLLCTIYNWLVERKERRSPAALKGPIDESRVPPATSIRSSLRHRRTSMSLDRLLISIIVPVYNNPRDLRECLSALIGSSGSGSEIIVVDDGSTDETFSVAAGMGVAVLRLARNSGPSAARNFGVRHARGDILFFVDADVVVMPGAVSRVVKTFNEQPGVDAVFGSYDVRPRIKGVISQYRNLLHHFVHQKGNAEASTFWSGCGAIRRCAFEKVGGFDEQWLAIEDIELGYRLRQAHHRILLDKELHGTHLKTWTLRSMIHTDVVCRAIPWARLIMESKKVLHDLNLKEGQRLSVVLAGLTTLFLLLAPFSLKLLGLSAAAFAGVIVLNPGLYGFLFRQRGLSLPSSSRSSSLLSVQWTDLLFRLARFSAPRRVSPGNSSANLGARLVSHPLAFYEHPTIIAMVAMAAFWGGINPNI